jgi:3-hydroxy-9,10-secoandrosta-1,3,5(10)-triene-9,17-dione monooxygenase reductase component
VTWLAPDPRTFRDVLGRFASGVVVVAGRGSEPGERPVGLTCQSFFSVSLDPPLVAVSPSAASTSWRVIEQTGRFAVSVLRDDQRDLCLTFGRGGLRDKFASGAWRAAPSGAPVIDGAVAWIDCDLQAVHPAGDHVLALGRVRGLQAAPTGEPLLFYRGAFGDFAAQERHPVGRRADMTAEQVWGSGAWIEGIDW